MGRLYFSTVIVDRRKAPKYERLFRQTGPKVFFTALGSGTARGDVLDYLGLEKAEKTVYMFVIEEEEWQALKKELQRKMHIDAPGGGIGFTVPMSSIGGGGTLRFLISKEEYEKGEESTLKETAHELIVVISNRGYTDAVMDAARAAGAYGGTVISAKGTGMAQAEKFMGVSIAAEKEMVLIVTKTARKNSIMKAVMTEVGAETKAQAIVFSLPVTDTAGLRLIED